MNKMYSVILIGLNVALCGCNTIKGVYNFAEGSSCIRYGDYPKAIEHLEEAVQIAPTFSEGHSNLAYAYLVTGDE